MNSIHKKIIASTISALFVTMSNIASAQTYSKDCGVKFIQHPTRTITLFENVDDDDMPVNAIRGGEFANLSDMKGLVHINSYSRIDLRDDVVWSSSQEGCGGTRISENLIVTAGHCFKDNLVAIELTYGTNNRRSAKRGRAFINDVQCHAGYANMGGLFNDIAVIDISAPELENLRATVKIAGVKSIETLYSQFGENLEFIVAGWGSTKADVVGESTSDSDPTPYLLKRGTVGFVWKGPTKILVEPRGMPPSSICSGDSGGPLYWEDSAGDKHVVGIVSSQAVPRGEGQCARANRAIFQSLNGYKDWIAKMIANSNGPVNPAAFGSSKSAQDEVITEEDKEIFVADRERAIQSAKKYTRRLSGFEVFKTDTFREPNSGSWIVNGDVAVPTEEMLADFYQRGLVAQSEGDSDFKLAIDAYDGVEFPWSKANQKNLTYCVSTSFKKRHKTVVDLMAKAARDWERYADVKFIYNPKHDNHCSPNNDDVIFDVRPINVEGKYLARAFFPRYARKDRNILIDYTAFYYRDESKGPTLEGILRHELGHILGARHEHTRPEAGACYEDNNYSVRTSYDRYSVMHYPQCNGNPKSTLRLSYADKNGIACVYGEARGFSIDTKVCKPL